MFPTPNFPYPIIYIMVFRDHSFCPKWIKSNQEKNEPIPIEYLPNSRILACENKVHNFAHHLYF